MADFDTTEKSIELARPVELYRFQQDATVWRYTSAEAVVTYNGQDYEPRSPMKRSSTKKQKEEGNTNVTISCPFDLEPILRFRDVLAPKAMEVTVLRIHEDAAPAADLIVFEGYIASVAFRDEFAEARLEPFNGFLKREIPRFTYQGLCNHDLYDSRCKINNGSFKHTGAVNAVSGNTIQITGLGASAAAGAYIGGYIDFGGGTEQRMILDQSGDTVTLLLPFYNTVLSQNVDVFQGCDHSATTCAVKFNNILNYGGHPFVPTSNPFNLTSFTKE